MEYSQSRGIPIGNRSVSYRRVYRKAGSILATPTNRVEMPTRVQQYRGANRFLLHGIQRQGSMRHPDAFRRV